MTLRLTPDALAAAYEYLRTTLPFKRWKLPHADEVEFHITRHRDREADYDRYVRGDGHVIKRGDHIIRISAYHVKTTCALLETLAHELIHLHQDGVAATRQYKVMHNKAFKVLARRVCDAHGWTLAEFIGP